VLKVSRLLDHIDAIVAADIHEHMGNAILKAVGTGYWISEACA
jgi:hypothetical protein